MFGAFVELELVRFFRRRGTFWMFALNGLVFALAAAYPIAKQYVPRYEPDWIFMRQLLSSPELVHNLLRFAEVPLVLLVAYTAAASLMRTELERGSWVLVEQCPAPISRILLARMMGVALGVLALHCFLSLFTLSLGAWLERSAAATLAEVVGIWLLACCTIPGAFLSGVLRHQGGGKGRLANTIRLVAVAVPCLVLLKVAIRPEAKDLGLGVVLEAFMAQQTGVDLVSPTEFYAWGPMPLVIIAGAFLADAVVSYRLLVRRLGRTSER